MMALLDRSRLFFYVRLAIGVSLLLVLVHLVDVQHLALTLASVHWPLLLVSLVGVLLNFYLKTYRWAYLLWVYTPEIPFAQLVRFNFVSMFLANFLPTSVASDVVRLYCVSRHLTDPRDAISSVVMDRIIGLFSLAIVTVIAFLALQQTGLVHIGAVMSSGLTSALLVSIVIPLALQHPIVIGGLRRWLSRLANQALFQWLQSLFEHFLAYQHRRRVMLNVLAMSFLNLFIAVLEFYVIAKSFSAEVPMPYFFIFIPLVVFLSMIPISVGGMGLLESALVFFFSKAGMPIETCLSIAVAHRVLLLTSTLPGGIIYMTEGLSARKLPA